MVTGQDSDHKKIEIESNVSLATKVKASVDKKTYTWEFIIHKFIKYLPVISSTVVVGYLDCVIFTRYGISNLLEGLVAEGTMLLSVVTYLQMLDARNKRH